MVIGIWVLISPAGFFHDQTVLLPFFKGDTVVYKESKRKEKWVELVLNCRTTLIQTHIKAFRYQTSLVQSSWEHFHFKLPKFNIFQGNFSSVSSLSIYIHTYIKDKREEGLANQTCHFFSEQKRSCLALLYSDSFQTPKFSLFCVISHLSTGSGLTHSQHLCTTDLPVCPLKEHRESLVFPKYLAPTLPQKPERRGKREECRFTLGAWDKSQNRNWFSGPFLK